MQIPNQTQNPGWMLMVVPMQNDVQSCVQSGQLSHSVPPPPQPYTAMPQQMDRGVQLAQACEQENIARFCTSCGAKRAESHRFCFHCGESFIMETKVGKRRGQHASDDSDSESTGVPSSRSSDRSSNVEVPVPNV